MKTFSPDNQGINRNKKGNPPNITSEAKLEMRFARKVPIQMQAAVKAIGRLRTDKIPNKVEIPFPPLNLRKIEKTCPKIVTIPTQLH